MDLFENSKSVEQPLAESLRPKLFDDLVGQEQLFSANRGLLRKIKSGSFQSLILWGPPGCGKTSFATALINEVAAEIFHENAIELGSKRIREIGTMAKANLLERRQKTYVFVDEIHRLNRGQQDVLLPFVEKGYFYLLGATTENPSYHLNSALTSRCRLMVFESLNSQALKSLVDRALIKHDLSVSELFAEESLEHVVELSQGDGRRLINIIEELVFYYQEGTRSDWPITLSGLQELLTASGLRFDKKGDEHYDTISAFIKSIRGSDPDAGIYYLARMLEGGEDPVFVARRLVILASEDIGNADPQALTLAVSTLQAVELVGMPEARITLAQCVTYLSSCPKSNSSYQAINHALSVVRKTGPLPVPKAFRSSKTRLMRDLGYGQDYRYPHNGETGWVAQDYMPKDLKDREFYKPTGRGFEKRIVDYLNWMKGKKSSSSDGD